MVFVTGGTGFLGAYVIKNLVEKDVPVRALRRSAAVPFYISPAVFEKVDWVQGDVLDVVALDEAMQGITAVVHAAAVVSYHAADRTEMYKTNVEGTTNVVNAAIENNVARFVHVSSIAALGRTGKNKTVTEEQVWEDNKANTHYGITKHLAELEAWRGFAEGLQGVIVNPSLILGYGNWNQSSCALFKTVYNGFPWYSTGVNGFVGVADVAEAIVQLLQSGVHQKRLIVSAENRSFQDVFTKIAEGLRAKPPHIKATPFLGELAWRAAAAKAFFTRSKPMLTKESARNAHSKTLFDNSALIQALPQFSFTPLDFVIEQASAHYLQAIQNGTI
ncbi:MAG TPA: NAD-dependent epimerase/dehydratase family protein [Chitinophagaceae bacterium]|nr:NAD-dependent epimerase/dehydratase family protein [Chitinophagaceae bacterium]